MKIQLINISKLIPYAQNPRHNQLAIAKVAASIKEFGWQQPIVVDGNMTIIAGHTRYMAATQLDLKKVPVYVASSLTAAQVQAYRIADNRLHEDSSWDDELLKIELDELKDDSTDLELIGFNAMELEKLIGDGKTDISNSKSSASREIKLSEFQEFAHQCPKCSFEWD
ncbi:MAG: hypothetical protein COA94_01060 [Rickettsiales bacterium]|nr:MAG: hypothetical protein COA94_01060 [Rickettsiales bacterium]